MARNFREFLEETPQQSWRRIRNLRAAPPQPIDCVLLANPKRADVFHTGLHQSEQLFRAAAAVERESRPLLLFYGLGQAGRALAAVCPDLQDESQKWAAVGHGLKADKLGLWEPTDLWSAEISIRSSRRDLFSRASTALGSALDLGQVVLGDLAANTGEFVVEFPSFAPERQILYLDRRARPAAANSEDVALPVQVPACVEDADAFIRGYPVLAGYPIRRDSDGMPALDRDGLHQLLVPKDDLEWHDGRGQLKKGQTYRKSAVAVAALGGSQHPVHPLMVWWMLLYALSMLARYEPSNWQAILDIRTSRVWSQVEYLQDRALDAVPELLAAALEDLGAKEI